MAVVSASFLPSPLFPTLLLLPLSLSYHATCVSKSPPSLSLLPPPLPPLPICNAQVRRYCVSQVDLTGHTLTDYKYKDIEYMAKV